MSSASPVTGCLPAAWKRPTSAARLRRPEAGTDRELSEVEAELVQLVRERIGAVASLKYVAVVAALPRSRSGKILHKWKSSWTSAWAPSTAPPRRARARGARLAWAGASGLVLVLPKQGAWWLRFQQRDRWAVGRS
ncbi:hypothetical protein ACF1HJ_33455 [Streptomyces sp. NPDC013978]|uniref:AMP-binding enzyme n=1 Tax=Streptomyces sp. NPDC013978 TaxID=3364869 RepID=UPI0036FE3583